MAANELAAVVLRQLVDLASGVISGMRPWLEELDLSQPLAELIWTVPPDGDPMPLRKLAARLHCDPSNVTLLSAKLEERGLAERRPHPRDGRVRTLVLTDAGRDVRERMVEIATRRSPLAVLDEAEQRQLHEMFTKALAAR
ncbi:MarR family winged helix-turn-helix transcriptional regulator [Nonomuraea sp. NPDC049714]|jgi:DNA-binding MarR family transcriptional regulator|uniref:MarR family winged helix-turn-helix transcriptional regulator n=1 Tax=unclassified Nonomuraea TaxID=2593643 RepID=UPI0037AC0E3E